VIPRMKEKYPGLNIGSKATFPSFARGSKEKTILLNKNTDSVFVTYYPLESNSNVKDPKVVHNDFAYITDIFDKQIYFMELGYPTSTYLNSSELKQAQFIKEVFAAWDNHETKMPAIIFTWLHDRNESELQGFSEYYGLSDKGFIEYLGSLGLRTNEGIDKLAFKALKEEIRKR